MSFCGVCLSITMTIHKLFRKKPTGFSNRKAPPIPTDIDNKDVLAFIIALFQLFLPLLLALLIVGGVVAAILSFLS